MERGSQIANYQYTRKKDDFLNEFWEEIWVRINKIGWLIECGVF